MWQAILSGLTLGLVLAISLGPVILTVIKQSLNNGRAGGFSFVAGVWLSDLLLILLTNAFTELVSNLMTYRRLIGGLGSGFLIVLGVYYIFFKKIHLESKGSVLKFSKARMAGIFSSGFLINTLNPNVSLFWLGTATAFASEYGFRERILIFAICLGVNIAADVFKVLMAGRLRQRLNLRSISLINRISGSVLIVFGIALFLGTILLSP